MKTKSILILIVALFLIGGIGCEKKENIYTINDFKSRPCASLGEVAEFLQEFKNVRGVITKTPVRALILNNPLRGDYYCVRVARKEIYPSSIGEDSINIYSACTQFNDEDLMKNIVISGNLFYTAGYADPYLNINVWIYVFTN